MRCSLHVDHMQLDHAYELTLNDNSRIEPTHDVPAIKTLSFNLTKLANVETVPVGQDVDVLGFCAVVGPLVPFTTKKGDAMNKRMLTIFDQSERSV
jgi:hypothetical protein